MATIAQLPSEARCSREQIAAFLAQKKIAAVGVSRKPADFTRKLFQELLSRGYEMIPVNPAVSEIDGLKSYANLRDIPAPVTAALLLTSPEVTEHVVEDCLAIGVTHVWMYRASGRGAVSAHAVQECREGGINVIAGECPFMFLPRNGFVHRVHGMIRKITGNYPR